MRKVTKVLAMSLTLTVILIVSIAGAAFAAGNNPVDTGSGKQNQGEVCNDGECIGDCLQMQYSNDYNYNYQEKQGPEAKKNWSWSHKNKPEPVE